MQISLAALNPLLDALEAAPYFEDAAHILIEHALELTDAALAQSEYAGHAQILRGVLHLRPHGEYRGLVLGLASPDAPPALSEEIISSATLWQWVAAGRSVLTIDVTLGLVTQLVSEGEPLTWRADGQDTQSLLAAASMQPLLSAGATHLCVVPLRSLSGEVSGMISIEARCRRAMGRPFIWGGCHEQLSLLVRLAGPYLLLKPTRPEQNIAQADELLPVVGDSMLGLVKLLRLFARQQETILLMGPTGAGKSRMARWCHAKSARAAAPFEVLDLLAIPDSMQLAHLVGWRRGAFTGADRDHPGAIARAQGGTLFIDEIDKLSLDTQAGLLRLLEERRYRPLGATSQQDEEADVRFIVDTNIDLRDAVLSGQFREDLYYRINVLPTRLPPLKERRDEIAAWAIFMIERLAVSLGQEQPILLSAQAQLALQNYHWPGNLRQLDNVMRRAYVIAVRDTMDAHELVVSAKAIYEALQIEGNPAAALSPTPVPIVDEAPTSAGTTAEVEALAMSLGLIERMAYAAQRFAAEAEPMSLDLDLSDAFKGFVIHYATERFGGVDQAFNALGRQAWVERRNHYRVQKREQERVSALLQVYGLERPPSLTSSEEGGDD